MNRLKKIKEFVKKHETVVLVTSAVIASAAVNYATSRMAMRRLEIADVRLDRRHNRVRVTFRDGHQNYYS